MYMQSLCSCMGQAVAMGCRAGHRAQKVASSCFDQVDLSAGRSYHYTAHKNIPKPQAVLSAQHGTGRQAGCSNATHGKTTLLCNSYYNSAVEYTNCVYIYEGLLTTCKPYS